MQNNQGTQVNAGFFVRFAAYLIDLLIVNAALLLVRIPMWIATVSDSEHFLIRDFIFEYSVRDILFYVLTAMYFIILTYKSGATVGKKLLNLRVQSKENRPLTLFEVAFRETVGRFLSALILNVGYIMIGIHDEKRGLHDLLSDTEVVYCHKKQVVIEANIYGGGAAVKEYVTPSYVLRKFFLENKEDVYQCAKEIFDTCEGNLILEEEAIRPELAGIQMFDMPLVGIGSASDVLYEELKKDTVIGPWHMLPTEWLPGGKTVISFFFPFTEEVKKSNRESTKEPSAEWLHGRIEGQKYLAAYIRKFSELLDANGVNNCVPGLDERFEQIQDGVTYGSNWSERHTAYICGLGTFGLSKGIITEKGMAGRFASIIIDKELPADERKYTGIYDYCIQCGACIPRCPVNAISFEEGKNHPKCHACLKASKEKYAPRLGCGLCQTNVPCESEIPKKES